MDQSLGIREINNSRFSYRNNPNKFDVIKFNTVKPPNKIIIDNSNINDGQPYYYDQNSDLPKDIFINMKIQLNDNNSFDYKGDIDLFTYVGVQPTKDKNYSHLGKQWHDSWLPDYYYNYPLSWWEGQLAAAIYIATTACGVTKKHLTHENRIIRSFYIFHVYYTVRKILYITNTAIPGDETFKGKWNDSEIEKFLKTNTNVKSDNYKYFLHPGELDGFKWFDKQSDDPYFNYRKDDSEGATGYYSYLSKSTGKWVPLRGKKHWYTKYSNDEFTKFFQKLGGTGHAASYRGGERLHPDFEDDIKVDQYKWMKVIPDGPYSTKYSELGHYLINKSIMVYFHSIVTAQSSTGGYNDNLKPFLTERFTNNVFSFLKNEEKFETTDIDEYYAYAKSKVLSKTNFSLGDNLFLIPKDMSLKQSKKSKVTYNFSEDKSNDDNDNDDLQGVSTKLFKPKVNVNSNNNSSSDLFNPINRVSNKPIKIHTEIYLLIAGVIGFILYK